MKTKALSLGLLVALFAGSALLATPAPAEARHDRHEWRYDHRYGPPYGHAYGHRKHKHAHTVVVTRPPVHRTVVVREHHYHYPPAYAYPAPVYTRDPAIVIGVSVPPIVIPLR